MQERTKFAPAFLPQDDDRNMKKRIHQRLKDEIARHKTTREALKKSEQHHRRLLKQSLDMQKQLRHLSYQILSTQEKERKQISRELHDVIAQVLTGINIKLATLKQAA